MAIKRKVGYMMQSSLAERLRVLRAQRGLPLTEAAAKIGVDRHTLRRLERGVGEPRYPTLNKIANAYGVPVEELLEEPVPFLADAPSSGRSEVQPPASGDEGRRALYLTRDLEAVRDLANLTQRELESVTKKFFDEIPDLPPIEIIKRVNGWSWRIGSLKSHVFVEVERWATRVLGPLSGEDLPDWERELLNQIRAELDKAEAGVYKLHEEFSRRWSEAYERGVSSQEVLTAEQILESAGGATDATRKPT